MPSRTALLVPLGLVAGGLFLAVLTVTLAGGRAAPGPPEPTPDKTIGTTTDAFAYSFTTPGTLEEAPSALESTSPYWFLNSGGALLIGGGIGATMHGEASPGSRWQAAYVRSNPTDTDEGLHPQNIFRLVTLRSWGDARETVSMRIDADQLSASPNRNESNGLLLMSRYQDGDTLYYAGIRVDGTAVIKKKYEGTYYTLAQTPVYAGAYDRTRAPDLLPHGRWLELAVSTETEPSGVVLVRLSMSEDSVRWHELLEARDDGETGTPPIRAAGASGIRTDFMDVSFNSVRIDPL